MQLVMVVCFFFSSRRRHTRCSRDWSSDVCSSDLGQVRVLCERTLRSNWAQGERAGVAYAYTRPSPERYRWQWYWDSCFAAIVWRRFESARSCEELRTLCAAAREDGFIGHTIFWERPLSGLRRIFYNVIDESDTSTSTIQPPMLAWAWR